MDIVKAQKILNDNINQFDKYFNLLIDGNSKMNLTAIVDREQVFIKHFLDSILPLDEIKPKAKVIDIGAGAGFPGLPIKIARPDISLTMLDALNKRVEFLKQTYDTLNIKANCVHARAEEFIKTERESYDVAVARAVAPLNTLVEYLLPYVKLGGIVLAYKGSNAESELQAAQNAIKILGGEYKKTLNFSLPNDMGERNIIVIKKVAHTPTIYPRAQNKPKLKPL